MAEKLTIGAVTAKKTLGNMTGSWRTFRPAVNEKCTGCNICVIHCPDSCMELTDNANKNSKFKKIVKINYDYCKGCLICQNVCPFKAIDKEQER